jgi:hypothetical protein
VTAAAVASVGAALTGATRTSSPVPVPSGVVSGDVVLVYLYLEDSGAVTAPAGFTELVFTPAPEVTGAVNRQRVWWKRATGADSGTYAFTHASTWTSGAALRVTGAVGSGTPVEVLASAQSATAGTLTPTLSATTAGGDRLLVFGATVRNSSEWSPPTDFTEQFDPPGDEVLIATKAQAAAGATGPLTASSSSSASHTATLLAVVPVSVSSDTAAPSAPSNLVATATGPSTIALTWDPATDNVAVAGYTVSRGGTTVATGITTTSYGDSGLSAATAYSYTVTAQDTAGNSSAASNTASATTGAAVPASLTVTPTPEPGATPPRMRLNVADTRTTPASLVTVLRINPDGTTAPVRTPDGGPLALTVSGTSRTGLLYDYEAPYGVAVSYTTAEASGTVSAAVTVDAAQVWLVHPGLPSVSMPLELLVGSLDEETWDVQQGVFWPMGREFPIVHTDGRRKAPAGSVTAQITSVEELRYLRALTADTSTLLLNIPAYLDFGVDTRYIAVGPVKVRRPSSIGSDPLRAVDLPFQVVDRPVGGTQAQRTLASFTVYPTLAALSAAYPDLAALAAGP